MVSLNTRNAIKVFIAFFFYSSLIHGQYFSQYSKDKTINFQHNNGNSNQYFYPEIVGSGVATIDYDNDGDMDIYLVQSGTFDENQSTDKLFKNLLVETGKLSFKDVTDELQLKNSEYGIGVASADINNDGFIDLYLTNLKHNKLLINKAGKGFESIVEKQSSWSSSASFCDINNDGFKDLYVSNYVNWSEKNNPKCYNSSSKRDYCGPGSFEGLKDSFYINNQGKELTDKTAEYFPSMPKSPGLNVVCQDINNDGWNDFIVANDGKPNQLWLNQAGKSFKEAGLFSGLAVNDQGVAEASMGMAVNDFDLDGDLDVFFTHLMNETNTLYKNNGKGYFQDITNRSGLASNSFAYTGWATGFLMVNNDIFPDLVVFNGAVADSSDKSTEMSDLKQSNQLYLNSSKGVFKTINNEKWLQQKHISRGAAFADLDNDGDVDIILNNNNDKAEILINNLNPKKWIGINYINNTMKNIRVKLIKGTQEYLINSQTDGSYASAHDGRIVLNQAQLEYFDTLLISRQDKTIKSIQLSTLTSNKYHTIPIK